MKFRTIPTFLAMVLCFFAAGCSHDFDEEMIRSRAAEKPLQLDSEQVSLNSGQLSCGVDNELWEGIPPTEVRQAAIYRLTPKGRSLQFSDDVYVDDPVNPAPFAQVRGKFYLQVDRVVTINTTSDGAKLVQAVVGVKIPHPCFTTPLFSRRIMAVTGAGLEGVVATESRLCYIDGDAGNSELSGLQHSHPGGEGDV